MNQWEYKVEQIFDDKECYDRETAEKELNELGRIGWELVAVSTSLLTYYLKRPS